VIRIEETVDAYWRAVLAFNQLPDFEALWSLQAEWFEPPNERRGGWSGVARIQLQLPEGGEVRAFLKRQKNHGCRTWQHPLRGIPTFAREFDNIARLRSHGIPTLEPLYFGMDVGGRGGRAILMTRALEGFEALGSGPYAANSDWARVPGNRRALIRAVAKVVRQLHAHGLQHSCLYPKHLMVQAKPTAEGAPNVDVRFIDLEKLRRPLVPTWAARHDLSALHRHSTGWRRADRLRFLRAYLGEARFSAVARSLWLRLARR
jgi:hypothetical protein